MIVCSVLPHRVHDDRHLARYRDTGLRPALGFHELVTPFLEPVGAFVAGEHDMRGAVERNGAVRVPIHFHPHVFEILRKRAERDETSFGEVVIELVERGLGG